MEEAGLYVGVDGIAAVRVRVPKREIVVLQLIRQKGDEGELD